MNNNNRDNINQQQIYQLLRASQDDLRVLLDTHRYQLDVINNYLNNNNNFNQPIDNTNTNTNRRNRSSRLYDRTPTMLYQIWGQNLNNTMNSRNRNRSGLTNEQLQQYTTRDIYSNIENPLNITECPISQQEFEENTQVIRINCCNHIFTQNSLTTWLSNHNTCPVCRCNIVTNSNTNNDNDDNDDNNNDNNDNNNDNNNIYNNNTNINNTDNTDNTNTNNTNNRTNFTYYAYTQPLYNNQSLNNIAYDFLQEYINNSNNSWNY